MDIEKRKDGKFEVEVTRNSDERFGEKTFRVLSPFGEKINCGDTVLGYDLSTIVPHQWEDKLVQDCPDVVLVTRPHNKKAKVKRLNGLSDAEVSESDEESLSEPGKVSEENLQDKIEEEKDTKEEIQEIDDKIQEVEEKIQEIMIEDSY